MIDIKNLDDVKEARLILKERANIYNEMFNFAMANANECIGTERFDTWLKMVNYCNSKLDGVGKDLENVLNALKAMKKEDP